ncbi:MAG: metallophosphoesterase [Acidobacteria bacterium]|nr:metallophosphoesterase [Acidobacteriota bacterium]MBV9067311.1 metallophosphoesterase [Acidobacteriota bacterium]MBV9188637.1 metallophosphoesterase [Acidobacteriota bacterium]
MKEHLRIAAIADIHVKKTGQASLEPIFTAASEEADVLLLCGDLTDYGLVEEAKVLAKDITAFLRIPSIGVLGNHDFESGKADEVVKIIAGAGVTMLDGDAHEIEGVGFAGIKGFGGGFGRRQLNAWGEEIIKKFVHETIEEALKLEMALARLRTPQKIAVLHYAPIHATVDGEPPEINPFLGSSRLEEPIDRYRCNAVFHGHAHRGSLEGRTKGNVPVYNVAMPLLAAHYEDRQPFRVIEVPVGEPAVA